MPEAIPWEMAIPKGSPTPTYNPSIRPNSTMALDALATASTGGERVKGTPPTPIPCRHDRDVTLVGTRLSKVNSPSDVQGRDRLVTILVVGPKIVTPAFSASSSCL